MSVGRERLSKKYNIFQDLSVSDYTSEFLILFCVISLDRVWLNPFGSLAINWPVYQP
jgi:hypothetical protein